jgi:hypothetical protein
MSNIFGGINTAATSVVQGENRRLYKEEIDKQNTALGVSQNAGLGTYDIPPRTRVPSVDIPPNYGTNMSTNPTGYIKNWLQKNNLSNNNMDTSDFFWRKYGSENEIFWKTAPADINN